ncbi:MAG: hypothetical protein JWM11_2845 [Planctomycetaceae bacterium]|nr:hypothetical protein [Planctomycetaceae bacterium]
MSVSIDKSLDRCHSMFVLRSRPLLVVFPCGGVLGPSGGVEGFSRTPLGFPSPPTPLPRVLGRGELKIEKDLTQSCSQSDVVVAKRLQHTGTVVHKADRIRSQGLISGQLCLLVCVLLTSISSPASAAEPRVIVREGLQLYSKEDYEAAREKFAAATAELDKEKSAAAAITAFDEACASHRKGDWEQARDAYLRAGLSQDRSIATSAHFNLGNLSAEQARKLAGDKPEAVPVEKRQEILDHLKQAIAGYRHCLELQPDHSQSRRNLELVRQWIKYYTDKWNELDRQKRRDESNLMEFLEYLIQTQTALQVTAKSLPTPVHADQLAELKRVQDELHEEIPTLREKLDKDLRPAPAPGSLPGGTKRAVDSKQLEEGIALLQSWADAAAKNMSAASARLGEKETTLAVNEQQAALNELDKIWDAVIPFHPLLAKELSEQTTIAKALATQTSDTDKQPETPDATDTTLKSEPNIPVPGKPGPETNQKVSPQNIAGSASEKPELENGPDELKLLSESQEKVVRKTRLLAPKAEAELNRLENAPPPPAPPAPADKSKPTDSKQQPDPELAKAGYRKAIELAPKAVEQMELAVKSMQQRDRPTAGQRAEAARKILEEIQQAQPKNEQQQKQDQQKEDQQKQDREKKAQQKEDQQKQDEKKDQDSKQDDKQKQEQQDQDKKDHDKKDQDKKDESKSEKQKQEEQQKKEGQKDEKQDQQAQDKQKQQGQISPDRIEEALRKVRERQQAKRERDRKLKGQILGRVPVDKDW